MSNPIFIKFMFFFMSFFGSLMTGILAYFLGSLINELKKNDKEQGEDIDKIQIDVAEIKKDIETAFEKLDDIPILKEQAESARERLHDLEGQSGQILHFIQNYKDYED